MPLSKEERLKRKRLHAQAMRDERRQDIGSTQFKQEQRDKKRAYRLKMKNEEEAAIATSSVAPTLAKQMHHLTLQFEKYKASVMKSGSAAGKLPALVAAVGKTTTTVANVKGQADCKDLADQTDARVKEKGLLKPKLSTIHAYLNTINRLWRYIHGIESNKEENCTDYEWTRDTKRVIEWAEDNYENASSRNVFFTALSAILKFMQGFEGVAQVYSKKSSKNYKQNIEPELKKNTLSETQRKDYVKYEDLQKGRGKVKLGTKADALVSLYMDIPPRRVKDYRLMRLASTTKKTQEDPNFNYLVMKNGQPFQVAFKECKTATTYGVQTFSVPAPLARHLRAYVNAFKIKMGDLLFPNSKNEPDAAFGTKVKAALGKISPGKKNPTAGLVRHAYITHDREVNRHKPESYFDKVATAMGHSPSEARQYRVIDE